ncbi:MAG: helix-turn-helix domain-containing protein [Candidatus Tyrphobacter sp.]
MPALGQRFRAAREARGLSLPEVAEQVRIRAVYLAAIENDDWSAIGAPVYIRGFLRTYARFLGLDAEEAVADFNLGEGERGAIVPARGDISDFERAGGSRRLALSPLIWIASLVAVLLIAFVVYNELTLPKPGPVGFLATPMPEASVTASALPSTSASPSAGPSASLSPGPSISPSPGASVSPSPGALASPSPAASISPLPVGGGTLALRLSGACWIRVSVDGAIVAQGTFPAGTTKAFTGRSVNVLVGNAGAADLVLNGRDLGTMGAAGAVVQRSFTLSHGQ